MHVVVDVTQTLIAIIHSTTTILGGDYRHVDNRGGAFYYNLSLEQ